MTKEELLYPRMHGKKTVEKASKEYDRMTNEECEHKWYPVSICLLDFNGERMGCYVVCPKCWTYKIVHVKESEE